MLNPGARLRSVTDTTEVIVVRAPTEEVDLRCGGTPMIAADQPGGQELPPDPSLSGGTMLGKRYGSEESGLELLCIKGGPASLSVGGTALSLKAAKPLPSSD